MGERGLPKNYVNSISFCLAQNKIWRKLREFEQFGLALLQLWMGFEENYVNTNSLALLQLWKRLDENLVNLALPFG